MVQYFLDGGPFMWPILALLIFGLGFGLERLYTLFRASVDTRKFMAKVQSALHDEGYDAAVGVCSNTRGPVAEVFHAGLTRVHRGIEVVEKGSRMPAPSKWRFWRKT